MDFSGITGAIAAATITAATTAIVAMGAVKVVPNFAKWITNKVAGFFR